MPAAATILFLTASASGLNAQITDAVQAHVDHNFIIGNTTLPPGDYTFRITQNSDLSVMTAISANDKTSVEFIVREAIADHNPRHSELVFRKYGNTEFLSKIFEKGSKIGVEVTESNREEARVAKHGLHGMEHSEEQK
jgi:hypothetical protein